MAFKHISRAGQKFVDIQLPVFRIVNHILSLITFIVFSIAGVLLQHGDKRGNSNIYMNFLTHSLTNTVNLCCTDLFQLSNGE